MLAMLNYCHFRQHVDIIGGNVNLNNDFIVQGYAKTQDIL